MADIAWETALWDRFPAFHTHTICNNKMIIVAAKRVNKVASQTRG